MAEVTLEQAMGVAGEHLRAGRTGQAEGIYRQLLAQNPGLWPVMASLGRLLSHTGRVEEGIGFLRQAAELALGEASLANNLGIAYVQVGKSEEAVRWLGRALELEPDDAQAHYNYARVLKDV